MVMQRTQLNSWRRQEDPWIRSSQEQVYEMKRKQQESNEIQDSSLMNQFELERDETEDRHGQ